MAAITDLSRIFRSAVVLVVEDELTRQYLQRMGFVGPIVIHVAGSAGGVRALVDAARADGLFHVYGVVDQDYGQSNFSTWTKVGVDIKWFVLPVHEAENLLLDDVALENAPSNSFGRTAAQIGTCLYQHAQQLAWTVALRQVLVLLHGSLVDKFPKHKTFHTLADALQYITCSPWFTALSASTAWIGSGSTISAMLNTEHVNARTSLSAGAWKHTFPGKELFRVVRSYISQPLRQQPGVRAPTASQLDVTLAQEVADWQIANSAVPSCIAVLRDVIRSRHGV